VHRLALTFAFGAMLGAGLPAPGLYAAIGLGLAAVGAGWVGYTQRKTSGASRILSAAALSVGALGFLLGTVRVVIALAAIDRIDRMLG